jgi:hypothetical protein
MTRLIDHRRGFPYLIKHHVHSLSRRRRVAITLAVMLGALAMGQAQAHADFQVGLQDSGFQASLTSAASKLDYRALGAVHGSTIRMDLPWPNIAPGGSTMPTGFNPTDASDPKYNWSAIDEDLRLAAERHLRVILTFAGAPTWAQPAGEPANLRQEYGEGMWDPSAYDFAQFVYAAAVRYSGLFPDPLHPGQDLPRVKYWEIFNEENLPMELDAPNVVEEYRSLLNAAYGVLKLVNTTNVVVTGGLAPVSFLPPVSTAPLTFAEELMCLQQVGSKFVPTASCPNPAQFDVFAIHPYSLASTPTLHALDPGDVLVADMGEVKTLLDTADRLHTIAPSITHQLWVTEWSWFTNPPQKQVGDAPATAARYVDWSMYEMWQAGVSMIIWFTVADEPGPASAESPSFVNGGGLYTSSDKPKLTLQAFSFPVVASVSRGRGFVWGRAPVSAPVRVVVERAAGKRWQSLGTVRTASDGVFEFHFQARVNGTYRAVVVHGPTSLSYNSAPIPAKRTHDFSTG